jgi:DNA-directed RNA polymerase subunit RPC12/RpoP
MSEQVPPDGRAPAAPAQPRDLISLVRHKLERGDLPKGEEARLTLNLGLISPCDACGSRITGMEHVAELHDGRKFRFHAVCIEAWQRERGASGDHARFVIPQPDWEGNNPEVRCAACGLRIQPFDGRYVRQSASFHPKCYDQGPQADGTARKES